MSSSAVNEAVCRPLFRRALKVCGTAPMSGRVLSSTLRRWRATWPFSVSIRASWRKLRTGNDLSKPDIQPMLKVMRFGKQPVRWAINPQYNLKNDDDLVKWKLVFTFTLLVPAG